MLDYLVNVVLARAYEYFSHVSSILELDLRIGARSVCILMFVGSIWSN